MAAAMGFSNGPLHDSVFDDKKTPSDSENGTVAGRNNQQGTPEGPPPPGDEAEARILKKLDRRIIPMCCWIYLMNFMDRGTNTPYSQQDTVRVEGLPRHPVENL